MSHTPHALAEEFPEMRDRLQALKQGDPDFHAMYESYTTLNHAIYRAESDLDPTDDQRLEGMKKERMHLKDAIFAALRQGA